MLIAPVRLALGAAAQAEPVASVAQARAEAATARTGRLNVKNPYRAPHPCLGWHAGLVTLVKPDTMLCNASAFAQLLGSRIQAAP